MILRRPEVLLALFLFAYVIEGGQLLPGGINLTIVLLGAALAAIFLPMTLGRPLRYSLKAPDFIIILFSFVLVAASFLTPEPDVGLEKSVLFMGGVLLPYVVARLIFRTYSRVRAFLATILIVATIMAIILTAMSMSSDYTGGRLKFFDANPIPTGTLMAVGSIIAIAGATGRLFNVNRIRLLCLLALIVCLYGLFLSGVRGPFISMALGLIVYGFLALRLTAKHFLALTGVALAGLLLVVTFSTWYPLAKAYVPNVRGYRIEAITEGPSTRERLIRYRLATEMFLDNPVLGAGTGAFSLTKWGFPHNIFLEIASELGIAGLALFVGFLVAVGLHGLRYLSFTREYGMNVNTRTIGVAVIAIAVTLLVERQFSFALTSHKDLFAFLGLIVNLPMIHRLEHMRHLQRAAKPGEAVRPRIKVSQVISLAK